MSFGGANFQKLSNMIVLFISSITFNASRNQLKSILESRIVAEFSAQLSCLMGTCRPWIEFKSYLRKSTIVYKPSPAKLHQRYNFIFRLYFGRFATVGSLWTFTIVPFHSHERASCENCSKFEQLWRKILMRHCIKIQRPTGGSNALKWSQFCNVCIMRKRIHVLAGE